MYERRTFCLLIFLCLVNLVYDLPQHNVTCVDGKMVPPKHKSHQSGECCPGYRQDITMDTDRFKCIPICMPLCQNGTCKSPGICSCNTGYTLDPNDSHKCIPYCSDGCNHGRCVEPEVCLCDHGYLYDLMEEICRPVCTEPCINGTCVSPENCQCNPGYRKSENNTCEPYCLAGCDNGYCIAPETCSCKIGWSNLNDRGICQPICSSCENGQCLAPGVCACYPGYYKHDNVCVTFFDSQSTNYDVSWTEQTSTTDFASTTEEGYETTTFIPSLGSDAALEGKESFQSAVWPVLGSLALVASVISLGILIINSGKIFDYCFGQSYTVE